jgi:hypothetical protein
VHYENPDSNRNLFLVDEVIENSRRVPLNSVLIDIQTGGLVRRILRGNIDPHIAHRAGKDFRVGETKLDNLAFRNTVLRLAVRAGLVARLGIGMNRDSGQSGEKGKQEQSKGGAAQRRTGFHGGGRFLQRGGIGTAVWYAVRRPISCREPCVVPLIAVIYRLTFLLGMLKYNNKPVD